MPVHFVLASQSPRRLNLLEKAGFQVSVFPLHVSENLEKNLNPHEQILKICELKMAAALDQGAADQSLGDFLLTADTMVIYQNQALGKPRDFANAVEILTSLSDSCHQVSTAFSLRELKAPYRMTSQIETTEVRFRKLARQEIEDYVKTGEPSDKAGAYAIQGLGKQFVSSFEGDFENVVGLPVQKIIQVLKQWGYLS